ncbi:MAG: deoxyhypusine synthase [Candidatus Thorarchaeota archaeon]
MSKHPFLKKKITPKGIHKGISVFAYNSSRLKEACQLSSTYFFDSKVTIGLTLAGAMTPAGLGISSLIPLVNNGYLDYLISTGANLYHDIHFALNYALYQSHPFHDDVQLRKDGIIRIYDILFPAQVLYDTDAFVRNLMKAPPFQKTMGTSEFHFLIGNAVNQIEEQLNTKGSSLLAACYRNNVPVFTSSPGDSTFGLNLAAENLLEGSKCHIDPSIDVNETSAIVWDAQSTGGESAVIILGGGSPKNFILQTEPHLIEIFGLPARGHDYFIQMTDSRPDTGGLSGATPSEALSWGKIDPENLSKTIVVNIDSTVGFPILVSYLLSKCESKKKKEYYQKLNKITEILRNDAKKYSPPVKEHQLSKHIDFNQ